MAELELVVINILNTRDDVAGSAATRARFDGLMVGAHVRYFHAFGVGHALPSPADLESTHGVVITGGAAKAYDMETPWLQELRVWLKSLLAEGKKRVLGICAGSQILAMALGGQCIPINVPEIGCRRFDINPIVKGFPTAISLVETHHETVLLPQEPGLMVPLGETEKGLQGFVSCSGLLLGLQGHPEYSSADGLLRAEKRFAAGEVSEADLADARASFDANSPDGVLLWNSVLRPWFMGAKNLI